MAFFLIYIDIYLAAANFFENGNGLLTVDIERDKPNKDNQETMKIKALSLASHGVRTLPVAHW